MRTATAVTTVVGENRASCGLEDMHAASKGLFWTVWRLEMDGAWGNISSCYRVVLQTNGHHFRWERISVADLLRNAAACWPVLSLHCRLLLSTRTCTPLHPPLMMPVVLPPALHPTWQDPYKQKPRVWQRDRIQIRRRSRHPDVIDSESRMQIELFRSPPSTKSDPFRGKKLPLCLKLSSISICIEFHSSTFHATKPKNRRWDSTVTKRKLARKLIHACGPR